MKPPQHGFTLIELLVSLAIMGFIGIVAVQLMDSGYRVQSSVRAESKKNENIARIWLKIQTDLKQIVDRPIRDNQGNKEAALTLSNGKLNFTRAGWMNPLKAERSQFQRLEYHIQNKQLNRLFWEILDRKPDSEPKIQMFNNVTSFNVEVMTKEGKWVTSWPPLDVNGKDLSGLPLAIQVTLGVADELAFTRIFDIASYSLEDI